MNIGSIKEKYLLPVIGIVIGTIYGIVVRVIFGQTATLASITFLFFVPAVLGVIPLIFASKKQLSSYRNIIFIPWITILTFFVTALIVGLEDVMCLMLLASPFFVFATLAAFIVRFILIHKQEKNKFLSVMLLPFLILPVEEFISSPSDVYTVTSNTVISAETDTVWNNIVEVSAINESEFTPGIFNYLGIPRPLSAVVDKKEKGGTRIGSFDGGLRFVETLEDYEPGKRVSFSIVVDPKSVSNRVLDQHVLNGNYFTFIDAAYTLSKTDDGKIDLQLSSRYKLTSKVNFYGNFWGNMILKDFQDRLLTVVRSRSEQDNVLTATK